MSGHAGPTQRLGQAVGPGMSGCMQAAARLPLGDPAG